MSIKQKAMKREERIDKILLEIQNSNNTEMINKIIGDDEKSRQEFEAYLDVWERSANLKDFEEVDADSDWMKVRSRMKVYKTKGRIPVRAFALRIAAVLVLALGLTYLLNQVLKVADEVTADSTEIIADANDGIRQVLLEDGTMISLNEGASIKYDEDFGINNRTIHLEGEAFFDVARNEELPFRVYSESTVVEVLGTSFNVKESTEEVVVGVVSGKVAFYDRVDSTIRVDLVANNTGYFKVKDHEIDSKAILNRNSLAWYTRKFVFNDLPLDEVCRVLADFYHLELVLNDKISYESITIKEMNTDSLSLNEMILNINEALVEDVRIAINGNYLYVSSQ